MLCQAGGIRAGAGAAMKTLLSALLLIGIGAAIGIGIARRYVARVRQLEKCDRFLSRLQAYLDYERLTTRELVGRAAAFDGMEELPFLQKTVEGLETEVNFPLVWQQSLKQSSRESALCPDDFETLAALGETLGAYDAAAQKNEINVLRSLLQEHQKQAQEQSQTNGKLARSLGVLGGITAALLIL